MSLLGALAPLGKVAGGRRRWLTNAAAYTLAGTLTSILVGGGLAGLGALLLPARVGLAGTLVALAVALVAIARESGLVAVPLPQIGRQTEGLWVKRFGDRAAAILWGLDLGLVFTTWLNFSGAWLLAVVAFLSGDPLFGAALFVAYWLGRALSVWVGPLLMESAKDTHWLLESLDEQRRVFRSVQLAGLAWSVLVLGSWIATGTAM
jgi:hypothetical protein